MKLMLTAEELVVMPVKMTLHLAKKHAPRKRNVVHAKRINVSRKRFRNNAQLLVTNAILVDLMVTSLARTKPERKNVKRTRKNVTRAKRCKRIVPRRARSARNKHRNLYTFQITVAPYSNS